MIISDTLSNRIADVVRNAINENVDPKSFILEVRECWKLELDSKKDSDIKIFDGIFNP